MGKNIFPAIFIVVAMAFFWSVASSETCKLKSRTDLLQDRLFISMDYLLFLIDFSLDLQKIYIKVKDFFSQMFFKLSFQKMYYITVYNDLK